ncbi:caspase-7-like [Diadema antillarum]|uniref:caspase-7-like n=1 Tax=Diadema antillarum TaxID=105358 RepID=UPI003A85850D
MGSKVSSNQHFVEAEPDSAEDRMQRSLTMSSATTPGEDGNCDVGAVHISNGISREDSPSIESIDVVPAIEECVKADENVFDINENFDFDSDRVTIDSDIMTMDNIHDGVDVVEVGIGKRHRPSRETILAEEQMLSEKIRSMNLEEISAKVTQSSPLHRLNQSVLYNMTHTNRGRAVIVNETRFEPVTGVEDRGGTDPDMNGLERAFGKLGFQTEIHSDLTVLDFRTLLHTLSTEDYRDDDCFAFVVMSHGADGVLYCRDGKIPIEEVANAFKGYQCPSLIGKPKLFFFQACRGSWFDSGVLTTSADNFDEPDAGKEPQLSYTIPVEADFLLAYSSPPGYYSWRSLSEGCWFIQALVKAFEKYGTCMELVQMMTRVNRTVAYSYESSTRDARLNGLKQMPCFVSTLTKEVYFTPKK